jgi:hypothetical protein
LFSGGREGYFEDALAEAEFTEAVVADGVDLMKRRGGEEARRSVQERTNYLLRRILYSGEH